MAKNFVVNEAGANFVRGETMMTSTLEIARCTLTDVPSLTTLPSTVEVMVQFPDGCEFVHGMCIHDKEQTKLPCDQAFVSLYGTNGEPLSWDTAADEYVKLFVEKAIHVHNVGLYRKAEWISVNFTSEINYSMPVEKLINEFVLPDCGNFCKAGELKLHVQSDKLILRTPRLTIEETLSNLKTNPRRFQHRGFNMQVKVVDNFLPAGI